MSNTVIGDLLSELMRLDERIALYDRHIAQMAREDTRAQQLMRLSGVGPNSATALLAMIGNGHEFKCGRQFATWLGVVPSSTAPVGRHDIHPRAQHDAIARSDSETDLS